MKTKTRNWAFMLYPESAPDTWRDMLCDLHIPALVSPLHDQDQDAEGNVKKSHHHVVLMFDGPVSQEYANTVIEPFRGTKSAEYVRSLKSYARYLAHLDDPDKHQYRLEDIEVYGGADLARILVSTKEDKVQVVSQIMAFCEDEGIVELCDLLRYARLEHPHDWLPVVLDAAYLMTHYLMSLRFKVAGSRR